MIKRFVSSAEKNVRRKDVLDYDFTSTRGQQLDNIATCYDCRKKIIASDDDAEVCIKCGGRNRRVEE